MRSKTLALFVVFICVIPSSPDTHTLPGLSPAQTWLPGSSPDLRECVSQWTSHPEWRCWVLCSECASLSVWSRIPDQVKDSLVWGCVLYQLLVNLIVNRWIYRIIFNHISYFTAEDCCWSKICGHICSFTAFKHNHVVRTWSWSWS